MYQVDLARDIGDGSKPQAWSKYSKDSSAYRKLHQDSLADGQKKAKQVSSFIDRSLCLNRVVYCDRWYDRISFLM